MENKLNLAKEPEVGTIETGNTIYRVFVQDIPGKLLAITPQPRSESPVGCRKEFALRKWHTRYVL